MTLRNQSRVESLPGRSGCFLMDVKEVEDIECTFIYNFFKKEENYGYNTSPPATAGLTESIDLMRLRLISSYIEINITPPDQSQEYQLTEQNSAGILAIVNNHIRDNSTENIMTENDFAGNHFTGVTVGIPNEITRLQNLVKESTTMLSEILTGETFDESSTTDYLKKYANLKNSGFLFSDVYKEDLQKFFRSISNQNLTQDVSNQNNFLNYENNSTYLSVLLRDITGTILSNPTSVFSNSVRDKSSEIVKIRNNAVEGKRAEQNKINIDNYYPSINSEKVFDSQETIFTQNTSSIVNQIYDEIVHVGYTVESIIRFPDGTVIRNEPKFYSGVSAGGEGSKRFYFVEPPYDSDVGITVSPVYALKVPIYKNDNGVRVATFGTIYVAGSGKSKIVTCIDTVPPPPPQDLVFNLSKEGLEISWSLPFNKQRDIGKFRIYRRKTKNEPFVLINEIDFSNRSNDLPRYLVEKTEYLKTCYTDRSFDENSSFIYAVSCVDMHDLVSNYSEQIRVKINPVFNTLDTKLFARIGAFIQYPNMTMEEELFEDVIKTSGYSKAKIYFNPDFLKITKEDENGSPEILLDIGENKDDEFKLNLINIDLQKQQSLDIIIGDIVEGNEYDSGDSAVIKSFFDSE